MEFIKRGRGPNFTEAEIETVNSYLVWGAVGLHYANQFARLGLKVWAGHLFSIFRVYHQKFVNDFLLTVVKSIFQEMISMDTLIVQIMNQVQKLVNADRASLFLVDSKTKQLYARFYSFKDFGEQSFYFNFVKNI